MTKRSSISTWIYVLLVFASGAAVGIFGDHLYTTKTVLAKTVAAKSDPNEFKRKYVEEMRTRLKLNPDQVNSLGKILDETRDEMHQLHEKYRPEMTAIHNVQVARVREMLTREQGGEYQKMLDEREAKRAAEQRDK